MSGRGLKATGEPLLFHASFPCHRTVSPFKESPASLTHHIEEGKVHRITFFESPTAISVIGTSMRHDTSSPRTRQVPQESLPTATRPTIELKTLFLSCAPRDWPWHESHFGLRLRLATIHSGLAQPFTAIRLKPLRSFVLKLESGFGNKLLLGPRAVQVLPVQILLVAYHRVVSRKAAFLGSGNPKWPLKLPTNVHTINHTNRLKPRVTSPPSQPFTSPFGVIG